MASTTDHENEDAPSQKATLAAVGIIATSLIVAALLVEPIRAVTPATLWTTDACPSPEQFCGQPAIGYLLPVAGSIILTSTTFFAGVLIQRAREE